MPSFQVAKPRMVLRIGIAGNRQLPKNHSLSEPLDTVLSLLIGWLAKQKAANSISHGVGAKTMFGFYDPKLKPLLRVVSGLAEGGDDLMSQCLDSCSLGGVDTELAGIIPFSKSAYKNSRDEKFQNTFEQRYAQCKYVLELDGEYGEGVLLKRQRAHAYRSQSEFLLRHIDLLIAVADPDGDDLPGGTLGTIRNAWNFGMPVLFVNAVSGEITAIDPNDLELPWEALAAVTQETWEQRLQCWLERIIGDPNESEPVSQEGIPRDPLTRLDEFFSGKPVGSNAVRSWLWDRFTQRFREDTEAIPDLQISAYEVYRRRATELNYHYIGRYRGAILLNYALAVFAVILAATSLVILGQGVEGKFMGLTAEVWLFSLTFFKLGIVSFIAFNTWQANSGDWNDRAIDYRYLAERLRIQYYLPRVGSFQPPAAAPPQFASRVLRQSQVDWLFDAIVRHVSPADVRTVCLPGAEHSKSCCKLDIKAALDAIHRNWLSGQIAYHKKNASAMKGMDDFLQCWSKRLASIVILIVGIDLCPLGLELLFEIEVPHLVHDWAPWMVALTAILPAAVASLNGLRFQSECHSLVDRSSVMERLLTDRRQFLETRQAFNDGSGITAREALRFAESTAQDMVKEVTEWSVIYTKELMDQ